MEESMRVNPGNALATTHTHTEHKSDQDYKRDCVQGLTYKVIESNAGDISGRATLTGVNKISVDASSKAKATGARPQ